MFDIKYIFEYANGGWKHFHHTFEDRDEFRNCVRRVKNDPKCIGYVTTNALTGVIKCAEKENGKWVKFLG